MLRERACMQACIWAFLSFLFPFFCCCLRPPLWQVWDFLLSDMPPSAWLLIAPRQQESRTSGTDIADGDREPGAERSPLNTVSWPQGGSESSGAGAHRQHGAAPGAAPRTPRPEWLAARRKEQLEVTRHYLTCPQVGACHRAPHPPHWVQRRSHGSLHQLLAQSRLILSDQTLPSTSTWDLRRSKRSQQSTAYPSDVRIPVLVCCVIIYSYFPLCKIM